MEDNRAARAQLERELSEARRKISELEKTLSEYRSMEDSFRETGEELKNVRDHLEELVMERTRELATANARLKNEIEDRREAEKRLLDNEEKYRIHFFLSDDVMLTWDNQFRVMSVSPNVERVLGYKPEELVGRSFDDLDVLNPEDKAEAMENAMHLLSGKRVYSSIYRFVTKDGKTLFGELSEVPILRQGHIVGMVTVGRNITKHIELENSLLESEERYRATLQALPDAVSIVRSSDLQLLYINDAFSRITGYSFRESKGRTLSELNLAGSPEDLHQLLDHITDTRPVNSLEIRCRRKDGTVIHALLSLRPVQYGGEDCMVLVMADMTAFRQIEEEKRNLEIQSRKMEAIGTLAGGIAHDFNNLLTTIMGYAKLSLKDLLELSGRDKDFSAVRSDLEEVRKAAARARDLINQILAFSGHREKEYAPIELGAVIMESLTMLRASLPTNIRIRQNLASPHLILGDPVQIHQALKNLCTNAANAMNSAGGELEVSLQRSLVDEAVSLNLDLPQGRYVRMSVKDTGRGMDPKVMARIFEPYYTTRWKGSGTGLGLSIVHGIVKSHGGAISCTSSPGRGTTFDIFLPEFEFGKEDRRHPEHTGKAGGRRFLDLNGDIPPNDAHNGPDDDPASNGSGNECRS